MGDTGCTGHEVLLERERELASIDAVLEKALGGRGAVAVVEGEAGVGKSCPLSRSPRSLGCAHAHAIFVPPSRYAPAMRRAVVLIAVTLALAACSVATARVPDSGIAGRVVAGPTCPVEQVPPLPQCAPRPLVAALRVHRLGRAASLTVRSAIDGRFRVALAPGSYVLRALANPGSPFPRPPAAFTVTVRPHHFTSVTVTYDTGIR